ncbi:MAG TPA: CBS domain-containing protein [Solirubrobacterales bacterium]|jgi:signal-transduction protein with cAMP-binding, CBS, and nucleotidyltransferase domain|nr:CBS domain-containing protein [Solirubrobacterales bacterium]
MQVRDGMSEITLTVGPTHTLREAAAKMVEKGTGAALVLDGEMPTPSVVTERDLLISVAQGQNPDHERVCDHMSEGVLSAAPDWSLERAAAEMSRRNVRHLVVFDDGEPTGMLSMRDIVRCWTSDGATSEMSLPKG